MQGWKLCVCGGLKLGVSSTGALGSQGADFLSRALGRVPWEDEGQECGEAVSPCFHLGLQKLQCFPLVL